MTFEGGPWGIVIIISALMIQFFTFGLSGALGVLNIEFLDYFKASASEVSFVLALNYGVFLGSGPIVSFMMSKFSYRKIVLCGSALVVIGVLIVPLFPNLYVMYLTLGVLSGFGCSCAYIPSHTLSGLYYDKYRSLATGVATSGSGLGFAVMPVLTGLFIEIYAWKGSCIIFGGLCLHLFVFAALLRDPPMNTKRDTSDVLQNGNVAKTDDGHYELKEAYIKFTTNENGSLEDISDRNSIINNYDTHSPHLQGEKLHQDLPVVIVSETLPESAQHIYIFKTSDFSIYFINNFFWNASCSMIAAFAPEYFRLQGFTILDASWIMGGFGFGNFIGATVGGFLGNINGVNRIYLFILSCFLLGVFTLLIPLDQSFGYLATVSTLTGLVFGVILGLLVVVLADIVGINSLGNGMGYIMLSNGLGTFAGPVFAGMLIDSTNSYESSVYLSGTLSIVSGVVMCLIPLRQFFKCCVKTPVTINSKEDEISQNSLLNKKN